MNLNLDQHLMIDDEVLNDIISISNLNSGDIVIEIGAGTGNLTKRLLNKAKKVHAFEIDESFKPLLDKLKKENNNIKIFLKNFLSLKLKDLDFEFNKIIANIPYAISEPLLKKLFKLVGFKFNIDLIVLCVGEKFANLLVEDNNKLSIISKSFFHITKEKFVDRKYFDPKPRTDSWIIKLMPKKEDELNKKRINN